MTLADVTRFKNMDALAGKLGVSSSARKSFVQAAAQLPSIDVSVSVSDEASSSTTTSTTSKISVHAKRRNALVQRDARAYTPRFPKSQTEGWFLFVLGTATTSKAKKEEVLAVKRFGWSAAGGGKNNRRLEMGMRPEARPVVKVPRGGGGDEVDVLVVSDCYPGLEYRVGGVVLAAAEGASESW